MVWGRSGQRQSVEVGMGSGSWLGRPTEVVAAIAVAAAAVATAATRCY